MTRQEALLKICPNIEIADDEIVKMEPCDVDETLFRSEECYSFFSCQKCRKWYWNQEANLAEVIHAKWIVEEGNFVGHCSNCGMIDSFLNKYCPECGAKMFEENNNGNNESN